MSTKETALTINSIEELTIHSLDRSLEGLEILRRESMKCGEGLLSNPQEGLALFGSLASNLHTFCVFEGDICSLFEIDGDRIRDNKGSLKSVEGRFRRVLDEIATRLGANDLPGLSDQLRIDLPQLLDRFQDLLPILKDYINDEYLAPSN